MGGMRACCWAGTQQPSSTASLALDLWPRFASSRGVESLPVERTAAPSLRAERWLILTVLLALAGAGWALVAWQASDINATGEELDLTMGMKAPLFIAMWVSMMVAMMFPAAAPMILAFARTQTRRRADGDEYVPTWLFVAPYVAVWTAFGVLGYIIAAAVETVAGESMWAMDNLPRISGFLLVAAGIYQLTPMKRVCLARCRTPLSFMLSYWRDGRGGAISMGMRHGLFCLGCCWVLFLVLLPLGVMNVAAMVAVAALVFAEKVLPRGEAVARGAAVALIAYGLFAAAVPRALPTLM
jgi:predicted metal-binding membrane protein